MLAAGALVRTRVPARTAAVINRAVIDVLMPVLLLLVLMRTRLDASVASVLVPASVAQILTCGTALVLARGFSLARPAQGSAAMTTTFSNTGFLGFPVVVALFGSNPIASAVAVVVDTVTTTLFMWTFGVMLAARYGSGRPFSARGLVRALVRPLTIAVAAGLVLSRFAIELPPVADDATRVLGVSVSVLVFLSLGLSLDVKALKGRVAALSTMAALKLLFMPAVVLLGARAMSIGDEATAVAVLQCAMPSAMVSVIIAGDEGCDRAFAVGVASLSTLLCVATLPLVGWWLER